MKHIILLACLCLAGCGAKPIATAQTGNPNVTADLLTRVDGCNIWRINDGGLHYIYFARCGAGAVGMEWDEQRGKTTERMQTVGDMQ